MKKQTLVLLLLFSFSVFAEKPICLKWTAKQKIKIPEPSDIFSAADGTFYIVSDHGTLFQTDSSFKVIRRSSCKGMDFEGITMNGNKIIVSDESLRHLIEVNNSDLNQIVVHPFVYSGGRNEGIEAVAYDPSTDMYVAFTEKDPCLFVRFSLDFQIKDELTVSGIREVSGMTVYKNAYYVLSDEEMMVFKVRPSDLSIESSWKVPVPNPEGICFNLEGKMLIISDDGNTVYTFDINR